MRVLVLVRSTSGRFYGDGPARDLPESALHAGVTIQLAGDDPAIVIHVREPSAPERSSGIERVIEVTPAP